MTLSRRKLLYGALAAGASSALVQLSRAAEGFSALPISTNTYPWLTFARRLNQDFPSHTGDELLAKISKSGLRALEPIIEQVDDLDGLDERLQRNGLAMPSLYVNSLLHEREKVDESIASVLAIARTARQIGTKTLVCNPTPIRWGGTEDKTDGQLRLQAESLDRLGRQLRDLDVTLAYHNHDAELRQGGREFHHMLTATDPEHLKFCFDPHWVFRGCGNSEVAVFDALTHYHDRIVELHLRQSVDGVWTETFMMEGDIDYQRLFDLLADRQISPHLVLEQAIENESPQELTVVDAHQQSQHNLNQALA